MLHQRIASKTSRRVGKSTGGKFNRYLLQIVIFPPVCSFILIDLLLNLPSAVPRLQASLWLCMYAHIHTPILYFWKNTFLLQLTLDYLWSALLCNSILQKHLTKPVKGMVCTNIWNVSRPCYWSLFSIL